MKFNLKLDESLFDDSMDLDISPSVEVDDEFDDDFSEYEDSHATRDVLEGPKEGADTGVAGELIRLINDEWEAIEGYNNAIATLRSLISENPVYENAIKVLEEIVSEENTHVGQLQEVLKQISPNVNEIDEGEKEARQQMRLVGGVLPVQSWDSVRTNNSAPTENQIDETCTLCDVDDDM